MSRHVNGFQKSTNWSHSYLMFCESLTILSKGRTRSFRFTCYNKGQDACRFLERTYIKGMVCVCIGVVWGTYASTHAPTVDSSQCALSLVVFFCLQNFHIPMHKHSCTIKLHISSLDQHSKNRSKNHLSKSFEMGHLISVRSFWINPRQYKQPMWCATQCALQLGVLQLVSKKRAR